MLDDSHHAFLDTCIDTLSSHRFSNDKLGQRLARDTLIDAITRYDREVVATTVLPSSSPCTIDRRGRDLLRWTHGPDFMPIVFGAIPTYAPIAEWRTPNPTALFFDLIAHGCDLHIATPAVPSIWHYVIKMLERTIGALRSQICSNMAADTVATHEYILDTLPLFRSLLEEGIPFDIGRYVTHPPATLSIIDHVMRLDRLSTTVKYDVLQWFIIHGAVCDEVDHIAPSIQPQVSSEEMEWRRSLSVGTPCHVRCHDSNNNHWYRARVIDVHHHDNHVAMTSTTPLITWEQDRQTRRTVLQPHTLIHQLRATMTDPRANACITIQYDWDPDNCYTIDCMSPALLPAWSSTATTPPPSNSIMSDISSTMTNNVTDWRRYTSMRATSNEDEAIADEDHLVNCSPYVRVVTAHTKSLGRTVRFAASDEPSLVTAVRDADTIREARLATWRMTVQDHISVTPLVDLVWAYHGTLLV